MQQLLMCALVAASSAHPAYVQLLPNGANVPGAAAIGHVDPAGGGVRNAFGIQVRGPQPLSLSRVPQPLSLSRPFT